MDERSEHAENEVREQTMHVVSVPAHLREQLEEHVRQLDAEKHDVSAYMGIKLIVKPDTRPKSCKTWQTAASCVVGGGTDYTTDYETILL